MPEGDSLRKLRDYLAPRLEGHHLAGADLPLASRTVCPGGQVVAAVEIQGKHLLISFGNDGRRTARVLRLLLGMHGSVHHYRHGESWRRPSDAAQAVLVAPTGVFVAFRCAVCELVDTQALEDGVLSQLGPELLARDLNLPEVIARARAFGEEAGLIAELLLDPRVAAGIGNVHKSETLHLCRVWPWAAPHTLADPVIATLYRTARTLVAANPEAGAHVGAAAEHGQSAGERLWVYGRAGEPCRSCRTDVVERARVGPQARVTYFCLTCQASM